MHKPMPKAPFQFDYNPNRSDFPQDGSRAVLPLCLNFKELQMLMQAITIQQYKMPDADVDLIYSVLQGLEYVGDPGSAPCVELGVQLEDDECTFYPALGSIFTYHPTAPNDKPPEYDNPPWRVTTFEAPPIIDDILDQFGGDIQDVVGLQPGDVFSTVLDIPLPELIGVSPLQWIQQIINFFNSILTSGLPHISFTVEGTGEIELQFLPVPFGGAAIVGVDIGTNIIDLAVDYLAGSIGLQEFNTVVDLNRDITKVPPEAGGAIVIELKIDEPGTHNIDIVLIPVFDLSIDDFLGYGGGFRGANLCGFDAINPVNEGNNMPFELRIENCVLQYKLLNPDGTLYQDWTDVSGWETNAALCFTGPQGPPGQDGISQTIIVSDGQIGIDNNGDGIPDETIPSGGGLPNEGLPPPPDSTAPDDLCNAAYYIAGQVIDLANRTIDDAASITISEFLLSLLGVGGWDAGLLNQLWDYVVSNLSGLANANLNQHRAALTEALYCNELDRAAAEADLSGIDQPEQGALVGALRAVTGDKFNLWAFVGSTQASGLDCSAFVCGQFTLSIVGDTTAGDTVLNVPAGLYNVEINGRYATRDNGRTYDGMYFYSGGDPDFQSPQPLMAGGTQVTVDPVSPRNTSNTGYSTTYNHGGGDLQIINADPQVDDNEPGVVSLTFNPV